MVAAERIGSTFESFLEEEGIAEEVYALAEEKIRRAREQSNLLASIPPIPVPPKTVFRQIEKIARERPQCFRMDSWHATPTGFPLYLKHLDPDNLHVVRACGTRHCLAGWIILLTDGGLEFESWLAHSSPSVQFACTRALGPLQALVGYPAVAALTLLKTLGWLEAKGDSKAFQPVWFFEIDEHAGRLLQRLAKEEAERFPDVSFAA